MDRDILLLGAAHSLNHSLFLVLPPLLGEVASDLGVSFQVIGSVTTVSFLLYGLGALVGGSLADRVGEVVVSRVSIALAGLSAAVFLLPWGMTSFTCGMYLIAAWASFYHPTANTLITKLYPENTAGAMGVHGAAASLGQVFTPTVAYWIGMTWGWRYAFAFFGAVSVVTGLALGAVPEPERSGEGRVSYMSVLRRPGLWVIILFNIAIGLIFRGNELFFPTFLTQARGLSGQVAALANSALLVFAVVGQLAGGWASDRWGSERVLIVASGGMVLSLLLLLLLPSPLVGVALFIVVYGVSYFGHQPAGTSLLGRVASPEMMGAAYGVMFFFAFGLGSVSAAMVGYLADNFSLEVAYWILAGFASMALVTSLAISRVIGKGD